MSMYSIYINDATSRIEKECRDIRECASKLEESAPSASYNSDYTAALEAEIKRLFDCGTIRFTSERNIHELATRLNAAIKKQHCA